MNRIRGFLSKVSKGFAFFRKTLTNRAVRENAILLLTAPLFPKLHIRLRVKYGHYIPEYTGKPDRSEPSKAVQ